MNYLPFGTTGVTVSQLCLGTMMFGDRCDQAEADRILGLAIEHGVTFIDTAAMYVNGGTERILGQILPGRRDQLFVATKVHKGVDSDSIRTSIDESLQRMGLDYVDLYMIHWPKVGMNSTAIMAALAEVVQAGKARFVGCCNYPAWLFAHSNAIAAANGWPTLVCNQIPYSLIERGAEVEILPQAVAENVAITCYRPLVFGLLAGKYQPGQPIPADSRGENDARIPRWLEKYGDSIARFNQFAAERNLHPAQLAVAWLRHNPAVTCPIIGVSSARQLTASLPAFAVNLSDAEYAEVTGFFDTAVKEEAGGAFAGLRREVKLVGDGAAQWH
jgi:aryl-alcohol dehydrogenase-like predicted oxidoreductase